MDMFKNLTHVDVWSDKAQAAGTAYFVKLFEKKPELIGKMQDAIFAAVERGNINDDQAMGLLIMVANAITKYE